MGMTAAERQVEHQRRWLVANPDYHANYRATHRDERRAYNARYQQDHREERAAYKAAYDAEHAKERSDYDAQYQRDHRIAVNKKTARWRNAHPEAKRASEHRRRARLHGVTIEDFNDIEIFERDNWVCGLCEKKINRRRRYPDPLSASLDHVIPLSKGGHHTRVNAQATHLRCNISKGDRV